MRKMFPAAVSALALTVAAPAAAAVSLVTDPSTQVLTGATGVVVNGQTYDVDFVDGTCAQFFGTCSQTSFAFNSQADAQAAAQALLSTVFLDGAFAYDSNPTLTLGCGGPTDSCNVYIPYERQLGSIGVNAEVAMNRSSTSSLGPDVTATGSITTLDNFSDFTAATLARFTLAAPPAVPEPATWAMMLLGFGAIAFQTRRKRHLNSTYLAQVA